MRLPLTQTRDPLQVRTMASAFLVLLWSSVAVSASPPFDAFVARFDKLWTPGSAEYENRLAFLDITAILEPVDRCAVGHQ